MAFIRNIIFDYGGVIVDLDLQRTEAAFVRLGAKDFHHHYNQLQQSAIFDWLDTGKITEQEFHLALNRQLGTDYTGQQIDEAWNAMLGGIPPEKIMLLKELRPHFRTFLLSNTNTIHIKQLTKYIVQAYGRPDIDYLFERVYYSFVVGLRKPDANIFLKVMHDNRLNPAETLFIDDSPQHVAGAAAVGLQAILYHPGEDLRLCIENNLRLHAGIE